MVICVCGASGFIGSNFIKRCIDEHEIVVLTRNVAHCLNMLRKIKSDIDSYLNKKLYIMTYVDALDACAYLYGKTRDMSRKIDDIDDFIIKIHDKSLNEDIISIFNKLMESDAIVNLAGASIAQKFLTQSRLEEIKNSRLDVIQKLYTLFLKNESRAKKRIFLQASATGVYDASDAVITEKTAPGSNFLAEVALSAENKAISLFTYENLAILRFGVVMGKGGGILKSMVNMPPFNIIAKNHVPYIGIDDAIEAMLHIIKGHHCQTFNMVAPEACRCYELLRAVFNRQTFLLWVPGFLVKLTDRRGLLLTLNQKVYPKNLIDTGYSFRSPDIRSLQKAIHS